MLLYFFNFSRAPTPEPRPFKNEGLELVDDAAAWEEATTACREKLREMDGALRPGDGWKMEVTDADGKGYICTPVHEQIFSSRPRVDPKFFLRISNVLSNANKSCFTGSTMKIVSYYN